MTDESLFAAALDRPTPGERSSYLDTACGDPDQRARLDSLLAAHDRAGAFLGRPAVAADDNTRAAPADDSNTRTTDPEGSPSHEDATAFLTPSERPDSLGRLGHYEVLEVLGRGGFGIVFRVFDDHLQRVVAVKVLSPHLATTSPARKRFLREARSAAAVQHDNVVRIHHVEEHPLPHLVMEYIPGETLQQRMNRTGPLETAEAVRVGRQIAEGLAAAHAKGLIHRDIKPSNILLDNGPHPSAKITDFGLARAADDASLTTSGAVAGTPMYMAPEQAKGETLDHRADLFSLGSVLYAMLTGRPPFRANSTPAVLKRVADDTPRPLREIIPEVPEWLCRIVEKLHAKDPAERFQTAREVADLLADCEKQLAERKEVTDFTRIPGGKPAKPRWSSRRVRVAGGLLAVVSLLYIALWANPSLLRYVTNHGAIEFVPADGVEGLTVYRSDGTVWGEFDATRERQIELPAGDYKLVAKIAPGRVFNTWQVSESGFPEPELSADAGTPIFLADIGRGDWFRLRATTRVAPVSPPLPTTAAEVLPFLAGGWKAEKQDFDPALRPEQGLTVEEVAFDRVAGGRVLALRTRDAGFLYSFDPADGGVRLWHLNARGLAVGPVRGEFNAEKRSAVWRQPLGGDEEFVHEIDFPDVNSLTARVFRRDTKTNAVHKISYTFTRLTGPAPPPGRASGIDRPAEAKLLDRLVGEWQNEQTVTDTAPPDKPRRETFRVTAEAILGGRFVEEVITNETTGGSEYTLCWYDPAAKKYRRWYFTDGGQFTELTGDWNDGTKTLTWTATDNSVKVQEVFKGADQSEFHLTFKNKGGKGVREATGVARRVAAANPLAVPTRAADFLPFVKGTWSRDGEIVEPKAEAKRIGGQVAFTPVAGGTLLRGVNVDENAVPTSLILHKYDPATGWLSSWCFGPDGTDSYSEAGKYDPTTRTFTWVEVLPGGGQGVHNLVIVDANSVRATHLDTNAAGKFVSDALGTFTRSNLPPVVPKVVKDPKRPDEAAVLDQMAGEWQNEQTVTAAATPDKPKRETFRVKAGLTLGGRFVERWVMNDATGESDYTVAWYDPVAKKYRRWHFSSSGQVTEFTGTWHDGTKTMTMTSADKTTTAVEVFKEDRSEFHLTFKNPDGKTVRETIGESRRVKPDSADAPFDGTQAKAHQQAWAEHLGQKVELAAGGMSFRLIPPGTFTIGSPDSEAFRHEREGPQQAVTVGTPFYMATHEVTRKRYEAVTGKTPSKGGAGDADLPVDSVSMEEAVEFCRLLSESADEKKAGRVYRLPTEAEWEYACRAGTTTPYSFPDPAKVNDHAWTKLNATGPQPVGQRAANPWGLFDMHGNVFERCGSRHPFPEGGKPGAADTTTTRGGSWLKSPTDSRSAYRGENPATARQKDVGFRVVCEVTPQKVAPPKPADAPSPPKTAAVPFDEKQAKAHQEEWAKYVGEKVQFADKKLGMELRVIPPGEFLRGSPEKQLKAEGEANDPEIAKMIQRTYDAETPPHKVRITRPFAIGRCEVTVGQFGEFVRAKSYTTVVEADGGYGLVNGELVRGKQYSWKEVGYKQADLAPVWNVTAADAEEFCKWLSRETGQTFRLPTEAEWEWACRAGTAGRTFYPEKEIHTYAWGPASKTKEGTKDESAAKKDGPQPVARKDPNPFGLHDTCGNVWEWCSDWYGEKYYITLPADRPTDDPTGPPAPARGRTNHRVQRGGSVFKMGNVFSTSTSRPVVEQHGCGFRVVMEFPAAK